jgi:hypothetical protein
LSLPELNSSLSEFSDDDIGGRKGAILGDYILVTAKPGAQEVLNDDLKDGGKMWSDMWMKGCFGKSVGKEKREKVGGGGVVIELAPSLVR